MKKYFFFYFTLFLLVFLFIFLTPKLSVKFFPFFKKIKFKNFHSYLEKTENFNPQIFWEFREFFCPGYFEINKEGFKNTDLRNFGFIKEQHDLKLIFAKYTCPSLNSIETLTDKNQLSLILEEEKVKKEYQLLKQENEFVYFKEKKSNNYYLIFLLKNEKMKSAIGFFDYNEKDKKLTENLNWLSLTMFSL
jgi:hypothetical protein